MRDVSFTLRKGEILGFAGLMGAGRTEVARADLRRRPRSNRARSACTAKPRISTARATPCARGIGYLSEDRKRFGLALGMDVRDQHRAGRPSQRFLRSARLARHAKIRQTAAHYVQALLASGRLGLQQKVRNLSGGNQQKVVIAKWLTAIADILFFDEPTRGIDVGAKSEIYKLLQRLADQGKAIIMISSELPEILRMSHRIVVMCEGRITGELLSARGHAGTDHGAGHRSGDIVATERRKPDGLAAQAPMPLRPIRRRLSMEATSARGPKTALAFPSRAMQRCSPSAPDRADLGLLRFASPNFMQFDNMIGISAATAVNGVLAIGVTFVIITGGIDLSVGTLMTFCAVMAGVFLTYWDLPLPTGMLGGVATGALMGLRLRHVHCAHESPAVHRHARHDDVAQGPVAGHLRRQADLFQRHPELHRHRDGFAARRADPRPADPQRGADPVRAAIVAAVVLNRTALGRYTFAIGSNEEAVRLSGVNVDRWKIAIYSSAARSAASPGC